MGVAIDEEETFGADRTPFARETSDQTTRSAAKQYGFRLQGHGETTHQNTRESERSKAHSAESVKKIVLTFGETRFSCANYCSK